MHRKPHNGTDVDQSSEVMTCNSPSLLPLFSPMFTFILLSVFPHFSQRFSLLYPNDFPRFTLTSFPTLPSHLSPISPYEKLRKLTNRVKYVSYVKHFGEKHLSQHIHLSTAEIRSDVFLQY